MKELCFGESLQYDTSIKRYVRQYNSYFISLNEASECFHASPGIGVINYQITVFDHLLGGYNKLYSTINIAADISQDNRMLLLGRLKAINLSVSSIQLIKLINKAQISPQVKGTLSTGISDKYKSFEDKRIKCEGRMHDKQRKTRRINAHERPYTDSGCFSMKKIWGNKKKCALPVVVGMTCVSVGAVAGSAKFNFFTQTALPTIAKIGAGKVLGGLGIGLLGWHVVVGIGVVLLFYAAYAALHQPEIRYKKDNRLAACNDSSQAQSLPDDDALSGNRPKFEL